VSATSYNLAACNGTAACAPPDGSQVEGAGNGANVTWIAAGTNAVYGIQNLGTSSGAAGCSTSSQTLYRITGVSFVGTARTVLESIYAKNC
jgi:type IV pilus assembly protein PilX